MQSGCSQDGKWGDVSVSLDNPIWEVFIIVFASVNNFKNSGMPTVHTMKNIKGLA